METSEALDLARRVDDEDSFTLTEVATCIRSLVAERDEALTVLRDWVEEQDLLRGMDCPCEQCWARVVSCADRARKLIQEMNA